MLEYTIFNAILFCLPPILYWMKYKKMDIYFFLTSIWGVTAILCSVNAMTSPKSEYDSWNFNLLGFVYLFIVFIIFVKPLHGIDFSKKNFFIIENKAILWISYFFILCSFISIAYTLPKARQIMMEGDYGALRQTVYIEGTDGMLYDSTFERICKNFSVYLSRIGFVMAFFQLTKDKLNKKDLIFTICLFIAIIFPTFLNSTLTASRGMVMSVFFDILITYILFYNLIPYKRKVGMHTIFCLVILVFLSYTIAVTVSRFGDGSAASGSLMNYFSHSMLSFNDGVINTIHDYGYGKYFFRWFLDLFGIPSILNAKALGLTHGTSFVTFIGCFYWDFGPIGTFIIACISAKWISMYLNRNYLKISSITLILFYIKYITSGVFVNGPGQSLQLFAALVVYYFLRKIESRYY